MSIRFFIAGVALSLSMCGFANADQAQQSIVSAKINPLPLYASPDDVKPVKSVPPDGMPWPVKAAQGEFYKVSVDGHDYWVDSGTIRASQKVIASCGVSAGSSSVAGVLGASTDRCK